MSPPDHVWGRRGALYVEGGAVHYRRAGVAGAPVVILLHGSPESASALHVVAAALQKRFDVIGLDTPGNGLSAPLARSDPDTKHFARHLLAAMDVFGVTRAGLYGFHTGAGTAMETALIAPERVAALALDGYAVWTPQERADLLASYCVVYEPVWDGSHLARIWARLEEQLIFFPWHAPRLEARIALPPTPMAIRLRRLRDWLTAATSYPGPYRAAFKRQGEIGPDRTEIPTLIGAMDLDPLSSHLSRLSRLSPPVKLAHWGGDRDAALAAIADHLGRHPGEPASKPDPVDAALLNSLAQPRARAGWTPDAHGGFLLRLWREIRLEAIEAAGRQADLDAALNPAALQARVVAAIQAETGL